MEPEFGNLVGQSSMSLFSGHECLYCSAISSSVLQPARLHRVKEEEGAVGGGEGVSLGEEWRMVVLEPSTIGTH